jgi:hypothetical protein
MRITWVTCAVILYLVATSATLAAAETTTCIDLVKECFARTDSARDTCFNTAATKPICRDSETGKLAAKRAEMSALVPDDAEAGPSLLGPDLVDRECIKNFDRTWMASVVQGPPSAETSAHLHQALHACARKSASDIMRP